MTSKLRIGLSHKTEPVRFSGTPPLNYLTVMHSGKRLSLRQTHLKELFKPTMTTVYQKLRKR